MEQNNQLIERIRRLCAVPGVSGDEGRVREAILAEVAGYGECSTDPLGNLIVEKKGAKAPKNKLLLSAHMDEVGFIITHIEESGLLRFACVGGIDSRVVAGKSVDIGDNRLYGVIGTKAVHLQDEKEREEVPDPDKLFIDIGAATKKEAEAHVSPGDRAVFHAPGLPLGDDMLLARALDDRAGCALLIELIRGQLPCDCTFAFTVQEETGCTGAETAGYAVNPDVSIVVEATTASDIPGTAPDKVVCRLGEGPVLSFMDRGTIYDRGLYRLALDTAKREGIPCQSKEGVFGGNESRAIQTSRGGVRALAVSLPCRYLHSPSNVLHLGDLEGTLLLLRALIGEAAGL